MEAHDDYVLRNAALTEAAIIADLINRAFAVERFFKSGDRTNVAQIEKMLGEGDFLLLVDHGKLTACVFLKLDEERAYAGMLAVEPDKQGKGLGRRMMREAESYARGHGCEVLDIRIVNVRPELSAIYERLGFVPTGIASAEAITTATKPVHFITLSKLL